MKKGINFSKKLTARTLLPSQLTMNDRTRMYELLNRYYDSMTFEQFEKDLDSKHSVIVLRDTTQSKIQGFSTLLKIKITKGNKPAIGFFSGDTVIEKEYWGQRVLGVEFLKNLWFEKVKNPFRPVYWFLISKGYKTYLLMANNFAEYYPHFEKEIPTDTKKLMDDFYSGLYPGKYDPITSRILFDQCVGKLKEGVACTTPELIQSNPKVAFFEKSNPGWQKGDELACIARMTLFMPLEYQIKSIAKTLLGSSSLFLKSRRVPSIAVPFERRARDIT